MRTGYIISGIGHGLLLLWLLIGGLIAWQRDEPLLRVAEVSLVSGAEFAALVEGAEAPAPARPAPRPEPPAPEPEPEPEPAPTPPPPRPEPPAPEPDPEPEPEPEPETPPEAPRVADEVIAPPEEPTPPGPETVEAAVPEEVAEPEPEPAPELPEQAPEATTTEIVTEAETPTAALTSSSRPRPRPTPPAPVEAAQPTPEPDPAPDAEPARDDAIEGAIEGALAEALGEATAPVVAAAPSGPPLTRGEMDGLRVALADCWNVGSLSTDALATTVVLLVRMATDGRPESVEMVSSDGTSPAATRGAYEAARRAVIRCGARGFPLPAEKYDQWREIEMTFDPSNMSIR